MTELSQAFSDARKYEEYLQTKMFADGYLVWAGLGTLGSLISYILTIFGDALKIGDDLLGPAFGLLWAIIVGYGLLNGFTLPPEEKSESNTLENIGGRIGIGWGLAFGISFGLAFGLHPLFGFTDPVMVAISLALGLGNLWIAFNIPSYREYPFLVGLIVAIMAPVIAFTPFPYHLFIMGLAIGVPYYLAGFLIRARKIPPLFERDTGAIA